MKSRNTTIQWSRLALVLPLVMWTGMAAFAQSSPTQSGSNAIGGSGTTATREPNASLNPPSSPYYGSGAPGPLTSGTGGAAHPGGCPTVRHQAAPPKAPARPAPAALRAGPAPRRCPAAAAHAEFSYSAPAWSEPDRPLMPF